MNLGIILSIESKSKIRLSCKLGTSVIASKGYKKGLAYLKDSIDNFMSTLSFDRHRIESFTVVCDITGLNPPSTGRIMNIGYIKQLPGKYSTDIRKLDISGRTCRIHSINLGLTKDRDSQERIKEAVGYFIEKGVYEAGLNSYFSKSYPEIENQTQEIIETVSRGRLEIIRSGIFNIPDYVSRERYLLKNLVHLESARWLVSRIKDALDASNIECPLYFLRGNGYLIDEASLLKDPVSTWMSNHTGKIVGSSKIAGTENAIVFSRIENDITASGVSSCLPMLTEDSTRSLEMKSPGFIPKIIHVAEIDRVDEIKEVIKRFNFDKDDFFPLINLTGMKANNFSLMNGYLDIDDSSELTAMGAASSYYRKEFTSTVFNASPDKIEEMKLKLREEAERYFHEIKLDKKNISYDFRITHLKYMKYNSYYIKLTAKGYIN